MVPVVTSTPAPPRELSALELESVCAGKATGGGLKDGLLAQAKRVADSMIAAGGNAMRNLEERTNDLHGRAAGHLGK
jgi:hypothetical protein